MQNASSSAPQPPIAVNLARTSQAWTQADSAAGFVLRYLPPMRRQLAAMLGSTKQADEGLKMIIAHLVSAGFSDQKHERLRDFLLRSIRSAARNRLKEMPVSDQPDIDVNQLTTDSKQWVHYWREGLLERAWRALERIEHATPNRPLFSVLHCATANPQATSAMLVIQIATETGLQTDEANVQRTLPEARAIFAQMLADEVADTLEKPTQEDVKKEINALGLNKAFSGVVARK